MKLNNIFQKHYPDIEENHNKNKKELKKEWRVILAWPLIIIYTIFLPILYHINQDPLEIVVISLLILMVLIIPTYLCFLGDCEKSKILQAGEVRERFKSVKKSETLNKEELILFLEPIEECFGAGLPIVIAEVVWEKESKKEIGSYYVMLNLYDRAIEKEENSEDIGIYQKQVKGLLGK